MGTSLISSRHDIPTAEASRQNSVQNSYRHIRSQHFETWPHFRNFISRQCNCLSPRLYYQLISNELVCLIFDISRKLYLSYLQPTRGCTTWPLQISGQFKIIINFEIWYLLKQGSCVISSARKSNNTFPSLLPALFLACNCRFLVLM